MHDGATLNGTRIMPANFPRPTPRQQEVLDRILSQRERLRARRTAMDERRTQSVLTGNVDPGATLPIRLVNFARSHPVATATVVGLAALAGPYRVVRWASVVLPFILRLRGK